MAKRKDKKMSRFNLNAMEPIEISKVLAKTLMQSVGVNQYIIDAFDNGAVLKTFPYFTGDFIVTPTDAKDKQ